MKLVITDWQTVSNQDLPLAPLEAFGTVTAYPITPAAELAARIADADVLLCNKTVISEEIMVCAPKLKYIGIFATGYNNIDLAAARRHGITVCNAGSYSTEAVAQHTFALILEHMSRVGAYAQFTSAGGWCSSETFTAMRYGAQELCGQTIGLVGYGNIGRRVAEIANAIGMRTLCFTRTPKAAADVTFVDFDTLLRESDIISVHCPLNAASEKLFDSAAFSRCKDGALFVNTARGGIVDEAALRDALRSGKLGGAAVDVLTAEPMAADCPLLGAPNCIVTPHVAWAPLRTRQRLLRIVCENLAAFLAGTPQNVVS